MQVRYLNINLDKNSARLESDIGFHSRTTKKLMKFVTRVGNNLINQVAKVTSFLGGQERKNSCKKFRRKDVLLNCIENNNKYQPT